MCITLSAKRVFRSTSARTHNSTRKQHRSRAYGPNPSTTVDTLGSLKTHCVERRMRVKFVTNSSRWCGSLKSQVSAQVSSSLFDSGSQLRGFLPISLVNL
ncbi:hypothetical protein TNCV_3991891 [Trichonephila clavipes]|uniref:Uncharacterized protein n=1 Tax=Trichonephila clavipes TaxID=2585209 RepID=A0A8X6T028_TRICX|nr:hypothetical protein TNCV_3991891 [Trichonephila clavipes]